MQRRKHVRIPYIGRAELAPGLPPLEVRVSNVSLGGLHLYCPNEFGLGDRLAVRMYGEQGSHKFNEIVEGRVVVVHRSAEGNSYGVQFGLHLDAEGQPGLYAWVNACSKTEGAVSFLRRVPFEPAID